MLPAGRFAHRAARTSRARFPHREVSREARPRPASRRAARARSRRRGRPAARNPARRLLERAARGAGGHSTSSSIPPPPVAYLWELHSGECNVESGNRNHRRQRTLLHARLRRRRKKPTSTRRSARLRTTTSSANSPGAEVAFLARHGRGHRISPSELNFRANIYGMKTLGVERILSLSAVGSLKEEHQPLDFVIPDQFFDRTRGRISTSSAKAWSRTSASPIPSVRSFPTPSQRPAAPPAST